MGILKAQEQAIEELIPKLRKGLSIDPALFKYIDAKTKVTVVCNQHGPKSFIFNKLIAGQGCPDCKGSRLSGKFMMSREQALARNREVHGELYGFERFTYKGNRIPAVYTCKTHGDYSQAPSKFWAGRHCPKCSRENHIAWNRRSTIDTITQANLVHQERYLYLDSRGYENCKEHREVTCRDHGIFVVTMDNHIGAKSGCPTCSHQVSLDELALRNFVIGLGFEVIPGFKMPSGKHIDIYIPSLNFGIEYNGLVWHSEKYKSSTTYHRDKFREAESLDIQLIQVFEDEYLLKKELVLNSIRDKLGLSTSKLYARNCKIVNVTHNEALQFFETNHIQGGTGYIGYSLGLQDTSGSLVSVMSFRQLSANKMKVELTRFASTNRVIGGFSKLLTSAKPYLKSKGYKVITSFSDNRWSIGKIYLTNGFTLLNEIPPDYYWYKGLTRSHKRGFQRKHLPEKLVYFDPTLSEAENCRADGYHKIWDAGKRNWKLSI